MNDLIRRQATYLALVEKGQASKRYKLGETWELNGEEIREVLDALPSAQPEPRTAYWTKDIVGSVVCSYCGGIREDNRIGHTQWCNCCGCFMRGEEND